MTLIPEKDPNDILIPFAEMLQQLVDYGETLEDPFSNQAMMIEKVKVEMPVEIKVLVEDDGATTLKSNAPTQNSETTIMPVFHRMRLTVELSDE
ncbi:hypothetical protein [Umezakia ovalisporum]|jgi:hypothetical protein|uniref:hypothetical protein n=1 Tax=Umezakia ovalisporum TaxID=75695 RepID=UPI0024757F65|nr:hypothetical protein [Umezakia ovalisporum]MBI1240816.1 hypothetical protein [Nostoc sp. RI_552]MDH6083607.1 hypothetical protein [Umezakia ovalisporum TAC611]